MRRLLPVSVVFLALLALCQESRNATTSHYFPLAKGAYWIYEGTVAWTVGTEVRESTIQWKMEVLEMVNAVQDNGVVAYVMKGHPEDLAWYEEGKPRSDYLIVRLGETRYYYADIEVLPRLTDESDDLHALVYEDALFLDIPLVAGVQSCAALNITRYDAQYCWIVGEAKAVDLKHIEGLEGLCGLYEYGLWMGTLPDDSAFGFVPGVGISGYRYNHHGTISSVDVSLTEYYSGGS